MRNTSIILFIVIMGMFNLPVLGQPIDVLKTPLVYHLPGMEKIPVRKGLVYHAFNDTTLTFDLYYPAKTDAAVPPPVVVFINGIGSRELPDWRVYKEWAQLCALHGMAAINYQSRPGKTLKDAEALVDYLQSHHRELRIDYTRIGIWSCSANVGVGLPLSMQSSRKNIKALVMYYGTGWLPEDNIIKRQDLEIQVVRAGLDFYDLNKKIEAFVQHALAHDAHLEYINYPEGQHAFDILDNTPRSQEIIKQTLDFLVRNLDKKMPDNEPFVLTNISLWRMIVDEKRVDETLTELKAAIARYQKMPGHTPWYNHVMDERNLNQMGYELLKVGRTGDAIKVFTANQEMFPEWPNAYDALGDAYEKAGDHQRAVVNARTALQKLEINKDLPAAFRDAIKTSAEDKIARLGK